MVLSANLLLVALVAGGVPQAMAHIALWHPSMYGWKADEINQNDACNPLQGLNFTDWWFHGWIDEPPAAGEIMELPAGGTFTASLSCNKAMSPVYGYVNETYACDQNGILHTSDEYASPNPIDVKGCGIGIAYKSDVTTIEPEDFTMISINYTCPWWASTDFQIPADLPPCPEGGCHCMWGWVHSPDSGQEQIYFLGYRCNITGATGTMPLPEPQIARKCPFDKSNCTVGSKQPHYWLQNERNNNFQEWNDPPFYNGDFGFDNGAQTDLFAAAETTVVYTQTSWAGFDHDGPVSDSTSGIYNTATPTAPSITTTPTPSSSSTSQNTVPSSVTTPSIVSPTVTPASTTSTSTPSVASTTPAPQTPSSSASTSTSSSSSSSSSSDSLSLSATEIGSPTFHAPIINNVAVSSSSAPTATLSNAFLVAPTNGQICKKRSLSPRAEERLKDPSVRERHAARAQRRRVRKRALAAENRAAKRSSARDVVQN